ncbi:S41 family peptidase [Roseateles saccharophilus]|uniref:Tricorn protease homolog n=1 Tax=Roseateles saccharophilus TaxID=304 RepID=A0A4R3UK41_ROSSA|nr:S41 family peptidase [Roseateles saccharophilus]MDG0834051.1 peptidase S41 [Roseateles saccharophilus]TCU90780.1 tricorn protease [Roseateles saccharophilus]
MHRFRLAALSTTLAALCAASAWAGSSGFYRQPALRGDQVYLVAEGDLWRVGAQGGEAQRLTTHPGLESQPVVSPDGRWLAFTAQYDGGTELYLMPAAGGVPKRLTWEGGGMKAWGFTVAGEIVYTGLDSRPGSQLFAIDADTGRRRQLPVGQASDGALSADGKTLYFTRSGLRGDNARQYRGGAIARLWALDLAGNAEARPLLAESNNDRRPMPYRAGTGERIAFLSDRDGTVNLWSVNAQGGDLRRHTAHKGWDIRHASIDGSRVVYALGADLYLVDLADNAQAAEPRKLDIALGGDFDQQRERWIKKPQDFLTDTAFAPDGERALLAARGHLATQGVQALRRAELPQPADGRCRKAEFSADSKSVFGICDFSGETEIWRFAANGTGRPERITGGATTQRRNLLPSPDGRWIAHTDKEGRIWLTDLKGELKAPAATATREIAQGTVGDPPQLLAWSPDGQALVWSRPLRQVDRSQLQLYSVADGRTHTLTSDRYDSDAAAFSPDGQWLYLASRRNFVTTGGGAPWGDRNAGPFFGSRSKLYALALQPGLRSPFAARDELEAPAEKMAESKAGDAGKKAPDKKARPAIVFDGLTERLHELPVPPGDYRALHTDGKRLWFLDRALDDKSQLKSVAIDNQGSPAETLASDVRDYDMSADGRKLMLVRNQAGTAPEVLIVDAAPKLPAELGKAQVRWSDWQIATQPRAEWKQMFADAWRMHRDHFYDVHMHGVDWAAVRAKYEPLVDRVTDRYELAELLAEMVGELGALHSQVAPGDTRPSPDEPGLAGLGGRFSRSADGWRIDAIYAADPELPSEAAPLAAPGLGLKVGDVITALNGRPTAEAPHLLELLRGQAGRQVLIDVKQPGGKTVQRIVTPVAQLRENQLRYNDWRVSRARAVEAAGQGRIGYVHLRAMGPADIADFVREFYAATDRDGLIIDVRYNNGGNIDSWILEKLLRRAWAFWQPRSPAGAPIYANMQNVYRGHTVVLMNEDTYSDGETFSEGFKRLKIGPVIGKRSSGAGVWLSDGNRLLDNGIMRAAEDGQIDADGRFLIEGVGVTPDIEVDNPPRATFLGQDAQLDAAIAELQRRIAAEPVKAVKPGPYPRPVKP